MSVQIRHYSGPQDLIKAVELAVNHNLYVPGWYFSHYYSKVASFARDLSRWDSEYYRNNYAMVLAFVDGRPVAVAASEQSRVMAFCLTEFRRNGFGSKCIQRLISTMRHLPDLNAGTGIPDSDLFWAANGVVVNNDYY